MTSFVYVVQNTLDGKIYVGVSANDLHRLSEHKRGEKSNPHLQNAIKAYGVENFAFYEIEKWPSFEQALAAEIELIAYFKSIGCVLYNLTNGGECWPKSAQINGGKIAGHKTLIKRWREDRPKMLEHVRKNGKKTGRKASETWLLTYNRSEKGRSKSRETLRKYLGSTEHRQAVSASNKRRCETGRCGHKSHQYRKLTTQ